MEIDLTELAGEAKKTAAYLAERIGPRPAGSDAEARARDWLADRLMDAGYSVDLRPAFFAPAPRFWPYYTIAGLAFLISALLLPVFPWLCLALPVLVAALGDVAGWLQDRLPLKAESANLLAMPHGVEEENLDLLLVAHLDTARALPADKFSVGLRKQVFPAMHRLAVILAIVAFAEGIGLPVPWPVILAAVTVGCCVSLWLIIQDLWEQLGARQRFTGGAGDNATGVGALLALAGELAAEPPSHLRVGFLFTGAEETGLHGAKAYAQSLRERGLKPAVINVDMVGAGERLRIITSTGWLRPVKTDAAINNLLERADPTAVRHAYLRRSGDFEPFLRAGIPAASLEGDGTPEFWKVYHTELDTVPLIDQDLLEHTLKGLHRLIWLMNREREGKA